MRSFGWLFKGRLKVFFIGILFYLANSQLFIVFL